LSYRRRAARLCNERGHFCLSAAGFGRYSQKYTVRRGDPAGCPHGPVFRRIDDEADMSKHSLIALNLMRGLAAVAVLQSHLRGDSFVEYGALPASQHGIAVELFFAATRLGYEAVMVFFVLSGFLVGGQVLARLKENRFDLEDYAIDRATRIFIPLIPACLLTAAIGTFLFQQPPPLSHLIVNMIGLSEVVNYSLPLNPVLWSLSYEIWFYILAGALGYAICKRINVTTAAVLALCMLVFAILQTRYLIFWLFGALVSTCTEIRFKGAIAMTGLILGTAGSVFYQLAAASHSLTPIAYVPPIVADCMMCLGVAITLPFLVDPAVDRFLRPIQRLAAALAGFSYTLYLTHRPTDAALGLLFPKADALSVHSVAIFAGRIVICLAVAVAFYFVFESNTGAVRGMWRRRRQTHPKTKALTERKHGGPALP
jgi:peptidoglycan/LPS O-acetylase OafA/YrhL